MPLLDASRRSGIQDEREQAALWRQATSASVGRCSSPAAVVDQFLSWLLGQMEIHSLGYIYGQVYHF